MDTIEKLGILVLFLIFLSLISDGPKLCEICELIDWEDVVRQPEAFGPDVQENLERVNNPEEKLGRLLPINRYDVQRLWRPRCKVCRILRSVNPPMVSAPRLEASWLGMYHKLSREGSDGSILSDGPVLLRIINGHGQPSTAFNYLTNLYEVTNNQYLVSRWITTGRRCLALCAPDSGHESRRVPETIQTLSWIKSAIRDCLVAHRDCNVGIQPTINGLRVIDCNNFSRTLWSTAPDLKVILAPKRCRYIALSYVWGQQKGDNARLPLVVQDAIRVTIALGLRYLWVDKYCIPQESQEKERLIMCMDHIYNAAEITIIAAAGTDADYGLPGVSVTRRRAQKEVKVGGCTILEIPDILQEVRQSTWATRGWTYQEGCLSRRRLIFTDVGILYHCRNLCISEPLQNLVTPGFRASIRTHVHDLFNDEQQGRRSAVQQQIEQFTRRKLKYSSDSLQAFQGVLNHHRNHSFNEQVPIDSMVGVPVVDGVPFLMWYHDNGSVSHERREDFPSWTWAGWAGGVNFDDEGIPKLLRVPLLMSFSYEVRAIPINNPGDPCAPSGVVKKRIRLSLTGQTIPIRVRRIRLGRGLIEEKSTSRIPLPSSWYEPFAEMECETTVAKGNLHALFKIYESKSIRASDDILAFILARPNWYKTVQGETIRDDNDTIIPGALILRKVADHYERVGYIRMPHHAPDIVLGLPDRFGQTERRFMARDGVPRYRSPDEVDIETLFRDDDHVYSELPERIRSQPPWFEYPWMGRLKRRQVHIE